MPPVASFVHPTIECIIGGYVYRGSKYPRMKGVYFFADFGEYGENKGAIWGMQPSTWVPRSLLETNFEATSFGEDEEGNLYVVDIFNGIIYRIGDTSNMPEGALSILLLE